RRCVPTRSRARAPSRSERLAGSFERLGHAARILTARLGHRRLAAAAAADVRTELLDEARGVEPALDERLVEVDDEERAPVVDRRDDRSCGLLLLAQHVREVAERAAFHALRLDEEHIAFLRHRNDVDRRVRLLRSLLAGAL